MVFTGAPAATFRPHLEPFQLGNVHGNCSAVCLVACRDSVVSSQCGGGFDFSDKYLYLVAALGDAGAFFGIPRRARDDWEDNHEYTNDHNATVWSNFVLYRPYEAWAPDSSWHVELSAGEDALCVAAVAGFCAVTTLLHCQRVNSGRR